MRVQERVSVSKYVLAQRACESLKKFPGGAASQLPPGSLAPRGRRSGNPPAAGSGGGGFSESMGVGVFAEHPYPAPHR